eukprot:TRINITY_DN2862_c0_g2_i1.p1 TRINITY_DN2862_c0_g2~~TRINITY_DN2862_c0_g2_i1.p1  ORF type:complete len:685 (+),score=144.21 TRINITY_DN2862_c0_g2_i1:94-2148(+)
MATRQLTVEKVVRAVKLGDRSSVRTLRQWCESHDPNTVDPKSHKRSTLIHWAAYTGHAGMVATLVYAGVNLDSQETDGKTPLHLAAYEGSREVCSFLLRAGADWSAADAVGKTPCDLALLHKHVEVAKLFPNFAECAARHDVSAAGFRFDESMWDTILGDIDLPPPPDGGPTQQPSPPAAPAPADASPRRPSPRRSASGVDSGGATDWRTAPQRSRTPPEILVVTCSDQQADLRGEYLLSDATQEDMPVWESASSSAAIYCNPDQLWLVHCEDLPHETGLLVSSELHQGRMPHAMPHWESLGSEGPTDWREDADVAVRAPSQRPERRGPPAVGRSHTSPRPSREPAPEPTPEAARIRRVEQREEDERAREEKGELKQRKRLLDKERREAEDLFDLSPVRRGGGGRSHHERPASYDRGPAPAAHAWGHSADVEADAPPELSHHRPSRSADRAIDRATPGAYPQMEGGGLGSRYQAPEHDDSHYRTSAAPHRGSGFEALQSFGDAIASFDMQERQREEKERRREERRSERRLRREEEAMARRERRRQEREHRREHRSSSRPRAKSRGRTSEGGSVRRGWAPEGGAVRRRRGRSRSQASGSRRRDRYYDSDGYSEVSHRSRASSRGSRRSRRSNSSRRSVSSAGSCGSRPPWRPPGSSSHLGRFSHLGFDVYHRTSGGQEWRPPASF